MSYHGPGGTWPRTWTQQAYGHHGAGYAQGADNFSGHSSHAATQFSNDGSIHQEQYNRSGTVQYPYNEQGVPRAAYVQGTAASTSGYHSQASTSGFASGGLSIPYDNTVSQYSQQP
ncbi:hypothetical protein E8E13_004774 [Curvularia kusanoi]|uniref:Uncharacterized protein n=1 Tax=Curvularia kusanoi TaxID=90978 RepID=A0A9P4TDZ5_CURKU|nr:hypothetical protein E8E13_004774 [Curvularia kusanoi]